MKSIQNIVTYINEFPTLPTIFSALSDVMANPRSTAHDAAEIISGDQAAASKVLKIANSSVYGFRGKISSISQAIFYLGFVEVKNLVMALSVINLFKKSANTAFNAVEFWKHSIGVGVITRNIGKMLGANAIENYFLTGILHDIGKLLFFEYFTEDFNSAVTLAQNENVMIREAEQKVFGISHTTVGEMIAEKWKLPINIKNVVRNHEIGLNSGEYDELVACVHLANIASRAYEMGFAGDMIIPQPNGIVINKINLPSNFFTSQLDSINRDYEEACHSLLVL